jgi:hypothetical protein
MPHLRNWEVVYLSVCMIMILTGCALFQEPEVIYLNKAKARHDSQSDVRRQLGAPKFTHSVPTGETVWRYDIWTNTGGDLNGPGTSYCNQYDLQFDRHETLRDWTKGSC